ncbi:MAG: hypothetical protein ABIS18_02720 [Actinomycetota bacterium]
MSVKRKLNHVGQRLVELREELAVADEQLVYISGLFDEAETERVVSATPLAVREAREASENLDRHRRYREGLRFEIQQLLAEQDRLLEQLV